MSGSGWYYHGGDGYGNDVYRRYPPPRGPYPPPEPCEWWIKLMVPVVLGGVVGFWYLVGCFVTWLICESPVR